MSIELYHITHIETLSAILKIGALLCNVAVQQQSLNFTNISHRNIQDRRARITVPCGVGGTLHEYVPFYFAPRSPMLYTLHKGNVQGVHHQADILHLVTTVDTIDRSGLPFVFTDGHAAMDYSCFYENLDTLDDVIDWPLMQAKYWADTEDDPNRKWRRQAEFLVYHHVPWQWITQIGVLSTTTQERVQKLLTQHQQSTPVNIQRDWYY